MGILVEETKLSKSSKSDAYIKSILASVIRLVPKSESPYIVGGFIRDTILERPSSDLDITIKGEPYKLGALLAKETGGIFVKLGQPENIARVIIGDKNPYHVDISTRIGCLHEDLARRDFTINAMGLPVSAILDTDWRAQITDPFGGIKDIIRGTIRGTNSTVFLDDPVRMLRAIRLKANLGFDLHPDTLAEIKRNASLLKYAPAERIRDELLLILSKSNTVDHIYLFDNLGILELIFPELEDGREISQPLEHHWNVLQHNIETVRKAEELLNSSLTPRWAMDEITWHMDLIEHFDELISDGHNRGTLLKFASLLHDVAKPQTKSVTPNGKTRFLGHHIKGAELTKQILSRLRFSRRGIETVTSQVRHHLRPGQLSQGNELPSRRAIYRYFRDVGDVAIDTIFLSLADFLAARGPDLGKKEWTNHSRKLGHILDVGLGTLCNEATKNLVDGNDLMKFLGIKPGPDLGAILMAIQEAQFTGEVADKDQALGLAKNLFDTGLAYNGRIAGENA